MSNHLEGRRSKGPVIVAVVVVLALIAAAAYWFAIRDDSDGKTNESRDLPTQTFAVDGVPFTFQYPGNFAEAEPSSPGILWVAGVSPVDLIDVKRILSRSQTVPEIRRTVTDSLNKRSDVKVTGVGTERFGDLRMLRFTADSTASGTELRSQLYYFSMSDAVWQLECQSQASARAEIDAACAGMLNSLAER